MRVGLCLGGGGSLGAFQVGVLSAISRAHPSLRFAQLTGTSAGAINAACLCQHERLDDGVALLLRAWKEILSGRRSVVRLGVHGVSAKPMRDALKATLVNAPRIPVRLSATDLGRGKARIFAPRSPAGLVRGVMASTAHPAAFPVVRAEGTFYGDGGILTPFPINLKSVDKVVVLLCSPRKLTTVSRKDLNNPLRRLARSYEVIQHIALERSIADLEKRTKVCVLGPNESLGNPADFKRDTIIERIERGEQSDLSGLSDLLYL